MNSATTNLIVGFLQDLLVTGGSIITGAMLATKEVSMPTWPVIILALLTGMIQAARRAQSKVDPSVVQRAVRTPEQLTAQIKAREDTIADITARVTKAMQASGPAVPPASVTIPQEVPFAPPVPPVTPLRVPDVPIKPQKDSS